jgi:beta-glucanase (GH16 family)
MRAITLFYVLLLMSAGAQAGWQMTFSDEFNGTALDAGKWQTLDHFGVQTYSGGGVPELQCYDDAARTVADGNLVITASRKTFAACRGAIDLPKIQFSSGRITSLKSFTQQYGYFEARFQFPGGQGFWPAFWLLPTSGFAWEIDIMEAVGKEPNTAYFNYHAWATQQHEGGTYKTAAPLAGGWHTYGVDWQPNLIIWYVDGVERARTARLNGVIPKTPGYILLNLAVGGAWPGPPTAATVFPSRMLVDYVRVWQRAADGKPDALPPTLIVTPPVVQPDPAPTTPIVPITLLRSAAEDRAEPAPLQGAKLQRTDALYLFTAPDTGLRSVSFWLDSATPAAPAEPPVMTENLAPFDLGGTAEGGKAKPFALDGLIYGLHTITARATGTDGVARAPVTASFSVIPPPLDLPGVRKDLTDAQARADELQALLRRTLNAVDAAAGAAPAP